MIFQKLQFTNEWNKITKHAAYFLHPQNSFIIPEDTLIKISITDDSVPEILKLKNQNKGKYTERKAKETTSEKHNQHAFF